MPTIVECPKCRKETYKELLACSHCKHPFRSARSEGDAVAAVIRCKNCRNETLIYFGETTACQSCGHPLPKEFIHTPPPEPTSDPIKKPSASTARNEGPISKEKYLQTMMKAGGKAEDTSHVNFVTEHLDKRWEEVEEGCHEVIRRLPDIGFLSRAKRLNAFYIACETLERLEDEGKLEREDSHMVISVLGMLHKPFSKSVGMFDILAAQGRVRSLKFLDAPGGTLAFERAKALNPNLR